MATSELEQEPDLNKAPPHLEGDLLKQRNVAVLKKGWKKYFFIVIEDHLRYYKKKEDYESGKEPISLMRLSQVKDITEAVFQAVPKKHHLNCGFSLVAFHEKTHHELTFHLLAETIDSKRHWVRGLSYIKSYWSKRKIRETILSEEKEKELLELILKEDDDDREVLASMYFEDDGDETVNKSLAITIHFGNGSKVTTKVSPLDTTSDLLENIKEQLTSSSTQLWLIDQSGNDTILVAQEHPAGFVTKAYRFYAIDPSQRVLVLFYGDRDEFETIVVSPKTTAEEVVNDVDIQVQLDKAGINNSGLFLKTPREESLFSPLECPSDVLFTIHSNGRVSRLHVGQLVLRNKALHSGRKTPLVSRTTSRIRRTTSSEKRELEQISEQEEAETRALDIILQRKRALEQPKTQDETSGRPATIYDNDWIVTPTASEDRHSSEPTIIPRARSTAISGENAMSPQNRRRRIHSASPNITTSPHHSPHTSPILSPAREARGRSRSPRRLPPTPEDGQRLPGATDESQKLGLQRRNASKRNPIHCPIINVESEPEVAPSNHHPPLSRKTRSPTIRKQFEELEENGDAMTNGADPGKVTPFQSIKPHPHKATCEDEDRLEMLFDRPYQMEWEEQHVNEMVSGDSLQSKMAALNEREDEGITKTTSKDTCFQSMIIDISKLPTQATPTHELPHTTTQNQSDGIHQTTTDESGQPQPQPQPMEVRSPNILKVVMLASETITSETGGARPMDLLSLSGVVIKNERGVWSLVEGANFHDPLPSDCADHTENFVLPGGIRAIFNHSRTPKRWHVLPPPTPSHSTPNFCPSAPLPPASLSFHSSIPLNSPQYYRKVIVTEIGAAFHDIVSHFEKTRAIEEKKRIGSDMINNDMGYTVRGRFCSALASLILDGLRPYRIQRLILNDIWKVTSSFCQEVQISDASLFLPQELDKLVQIMQAISSVRALRDHNVKFRTFVCLCMSRGLLCKWLQMLPELNDTLGKFYQPQAFLVQATDNSWNQRLYNDILKDLEPLNFLPFDLSIDFENKQLDVYSTETRNYSRIPTPNPSPHPSPRHSPPSSPTQTSPAHSPLLATKSSNSSSPNTPQKRPSVTVIKNAATGQRTNNIITAVWEEPNESDPFLKIKGEDDSAVVEEPDIPTNLADLGREKREERQAVREADRVEEKRRESDGGTGGLVKAASWLRKLATSLQNLSTTGGDIEEPVKQYTSPQHPVKRHVKALYANIAEDMDELSFSKGDVMCVTGNINQDWLICSLGHRTGIVPTNFVQEV